MTARSQRATHGLAWLATTIEALRQMARWAHALAEENRLGECEKLIVQAAFGEYLSQILGGIPMNQNEIVRPGDLMLDDEVMREFRSQAIKELIALGTDTGTRAALAKMLAAQRGAVTIGDPGLGETMGTRCANNSFDSRKTKYRRMPIAGTSKTNSSRWTWFRN